MNPQTELVLNFIMDDIHDWKEWLLDKCEFWSHETIKESVIDYFHYRERCKSQFMIKICQQAMEEVDWHEIDYQIRNYYD